MLEPVPVLKLELELVVVMAMAVMVMVGTYHFEDLVQLLWLLVVLFD